MSLDNSASIPIFYVVHDRSVDASIKSAIEFLDDFKKTGHSDDLDNALDAFKNAFTKAKKRIAFSSDKKYQYDLAYVLRKTASTQIKHCFIKDGPKSQKDAFDMQAIYQSAKRTLQKALAIHRAYPAKDEDLVLEHRRVLHQLRKIAYELKDGELLENSVNELYSLFDEDTVNNFVVDCHESFFHIHFAKSDFTAAEFHVKKCIELSNKLKLDASKHYIHNIKNTIMQFVTSESTQDNQRFSSQIEHAFWKVYDNDKSKLTTEKSDQAKMRFLKDLVFLFSVRCLKLLIEGPSRLSPKDYVLREARKYFTTDTENYRQLVGILNHRETEIRTNHTLPLDYEYFTDFTPPSIPIPANKINSLFSSPLPTTYVSRSPSAAPSQTEQEVWDISRQAHNKSI